MQVSENTDTPPEPADSFEAAIAEREAARKPAAKAPVKGQAEAATSGEVDKGVAESGAPASETTAQGTENAAPAAPATAASSDLSWLPENLRSKVPTLSKELRDYLASLAKDSDSYKELRKEFTQKTQARAEIEADAARWKAVEADPDAADAAIKVIERKKNGKAAPAQDDGWDFTDHTSAENKEYLRKMAREVAAEEAGAVVKKQVVEPQERKNAIGHALAEYAESNGVDQARMLAGMEAVKRLQADGIVGEWTPKSAARLIELGLNLVPNGSTNNHVVRSEAPGLAKVASPSSRGVGTTAPKTPAWKRDGAKWPRTAAERAEYFSTLDVGQVAPES